VKQSLADGRPFRRYGWKVHHAAAWSCWLPALRQSRRLWSSSAACRECFASCSRSADQPPRWTAHPATNTSCHGLICAGTVQYGIPGTGSSCCHSGNTVCSMCIWEVQMSKDTKLLRTKCTFHNQSLFSAIRPAAAPDRTWETYRVFMFSLGRQFSRLKFRS